VQDLTWRSKLSKYPLISVVTAVRNGAPYIGQLIESVLQQDYPNFEHIIIDDGSTDDGATVRVLGSYPHLRWWSRENKGQYATQNVGIAAAHGEFISVISADDTYIIPHTFSQVHTSLLTHPEADLIYGKTMHMDEAGSPQPYQIDVTGRYPKWLIRYYLYIQHCSLFVKRDLVVNHNVWFDPSFKYAGDWEWIIRLFNLSSHIHYINSPLSVIRDHPNQTSRRATAKAIRKEHQTVCEKHNASYSGHLLLTKCHQYRAMMLIAAVSLRTKGLGETIQLGRRWLSRGNRRAEVYQSAQR
jgi:glycosyltransferase involved in cell wall biosynthesis